MKSEKDQAPPQWKLREEHSTIMPKLMLRDI